MRRTPVNFKGRPMLLTTAILGALALGALATSFATAPPRTTNGTKPMTTTDQDGGGKKKIYSASGHDVTPLSEEKVSELAKDLDPEVFRITQRDGTEPAFCGNLLDNKKDGTYTCTVCGLPLFKSEHKFTSGTGWPSFFTTYDPAHVGETVDRSHGMTRTEITCNRCDAHLGHVFPDGPAPTNLRYCLNSASLEFLEDGKDVPRRSQPALETGYFAGGCFWGVEHAFQQIPGVLDVSSGYQQGDTSNPTYKEICTEPTNHAESVRVVFDPTKVDYETLVKFFFIVHDPTQLNRQGPDYGTQYRSGIYTTSKRQQEAAQRVRAQLQASDTFKGRKIVSEIEPAETFWPAEDYHQDYIVKTGRTCHVNIPAALEAIGLGQDQSSSTPKR
ncbi:MAG: bifunctional methionine sulfoxide reductase B/A protein [Phycisphaerales bacterium]|nr:bifunctional methionine sulfoxide reductase B/A protein [Phycisphaerales bacterium]